MALKRLIGNGQPFRMKRTIKWYIHIITIFNKKPTKHYYYLENTMRTIQWLHPEIATDTIVSAIPAKTEAIAITKLRSFIRYDRTLRFDNRKVSFKDHPILTWDKLIAILDKLPEKKDPLFPVIYKPKTSTKPRYKRTKMQALQTAIQG